MKGPGICGMLRSDSPEPALCDAGSLMKAPEDIDAVKRERDFLRQRVIDLTKENDYLRDQLYPEV